MTQDDHAVTCPHYVDGMAECTCMPEHTPWDKVLIVLWTSAIAIMMWYVLWLTAILTVRWLS